jgi:hypothetical protein
MMTRRLKRGSGCNVRALAGAALLAVLGQPAKATDEIQVYNAGIAAVGQFTIQQHLNYTPVGIKDPPFPGGLVSNGAINGTPEFAYGVTDWWEVGLYLPFAIERLQAAHAVRLAPRRPARLLLRHQFRVQQHHPEIRADPVCTGDPTHHRHPQRGLRIHRQPDS